LTAHLFSPIIETHFFILKKSADGVSLASQDREINSSLLVYTDLDGTLLDFHSYSFEPTLPALTILKKKGISLIICSSKTRAEIEKIRLDLKNTHPFISENGGAIFIPKTYSLQDIHIDKQDQDYFIIELGSTYQKIREVLKKIQSSFPAKIRGFGDLSTEEVADLCGFSSDLARLSKKREYDEPFLVDDSTLIAQIEKIARRSQLRVEQGGRFFHLAGANDKGKALSLLTKIYRKKMKSLKTIALGDSQNDLPMLKAVDFPVLLPKPDGDHDSLIKLDNLILASGAGPAGWNAAVLKLLDDLL
jgi:mannosyl-3-phosphoglycerate phosphatase